VIFGELFSRGYANGIVDRARQAGVQVISSTVGRRDPSAGLRPLNPEELSTHSERDSLINVPLEAGFDLTPGPNGLTPVDRLQSLKMSDWEKAELPESDLFFARDRAREDFRQRVRLHLEALRPRIEGRRRVVFVHTMAGGVPRAKILMPTMNKVFKGLGERHIPSERLWNSTIGRLCELNFAEVTAETFDILIEETADLRRQFGPECVSYLAYGYHGTEVLLGDQFQWQTYTPYVQGWAKRRLEEISRQRSRQGILTAVYNCPEILTNSSSIFLGVEVSLYPLLAALRPFAPRSERVNRLLETCQAKLKPGVTFEQIQEVTNSYLRNPVVQEHCQFSKWPQHNRADQMELMLTASETLIGLHRDEKDLITSTLSEEVFRTCGEVMFRDAARPQLPVAWLGHDLLAQISAELQ
jgi:hypothetical protein